MSECYVSIIQDLNIVLSNIRHSAIKNKNNAIVS